MALKTSSRGEISPFIVMEVMRAAAERAASGAGVLHMEVGQPGTGAPGGVIEAARAALDGHRIGYTVALGIPELREAIAGYLGRARGVACSPEQVLVTAGSQQAIDLAARREALILDPVYTGKAMAATINRAGKTGPDHNILFIHTGGNPASFAYAGQLTDELAKLRAND